ncbi:glycosyltransferase family 2 protein [Aeromonas enteropelogenes]|uniref:glycosyltransferase family 2 protein n=1 Tax=Aeromonas enteropelogenes TaxID=29489 RepID=UPI003BA1E457
MYNYSYEYYLGRVSNPKIVVITRVRNESLIISDFLEHVSTFCDAIIALDDCSTDNTLPILQQHSKVTAIIRNNKWERGNRTGQETAHRKLLNDITMRLFRPQWIIYMDADERLIGNIRIELETLDYKNIDYIRIPLFDAYMTNDDNLDIREGEALINRRKYFGPERRDIIFIWSSLSGADFVLDDAREPTINSEKYLTLFKCQHFGKALSIKKWEEKCDYYINNFPGVYSDKWLKRKGHAIHEKSDFSTPLYPWGETLFDNAVIIHPIIP